MNEQIVLSAEALAHLQQQLEESTRRMVVYNNYGDCVGIMNLTRFMVASIVDAGDRLEIEYEHDDPSMVSPATITLSVHRLSMYFDERTIDDLRNAGVSFLIEG